MKIFRQTGIFTALLMSGLLATACGSSDSGTDDGGTGGGGTSTATTSSSASATTTALNNLTNGTVSGVNGGTGALVKAALKKRMAAAVTEETITIDEEYTFACTDFPDPEEIDSDLDGTADLIVTCESGSLTSAANGEVTLSMNDLDTVDTTDDTVDIAIAADMTASYDAFTTTIEVVDVCTMTSAVDGDVEGSLDLASSNNGADIEGSVTFTAGDVDACTGGLTVTVGGESHDVQMSLGATIAAGEEEPTYTGTVCIDGESFDFDELSDLTEFDDTELPCDAAE